MSLPRALADLQRGNIAPVDLAQAAIGPGVAVFTRYEQVLDAQGQPLSVREALALINCTLDEALARQEGDFDADSRWALTWYEQSGFAEGDFGVADVLARAKNTSVAGMVDAGIVTSARGKVRLLRPDELDPAWDPATDRRRPAWQAVHQLIAAAEQGETALAELIAKLGPEAEVARELATASTRSPTARSDRPRPSGTTASSRAGPRPCGWRGHRGPRPASSRRCSRGERQPQR